MPDKIFITAEASEHKLKRESKGSSLIGIKLRLGAFATKKPFSNLSGFVWTEFLSGEKVAFSNLSGLVGGRSLSFPRRFGKKKKNVIPINLHAHFCNETD